MKLLITKYSHRIINQKSINCCCPIVIITLIEYLIQKDFNKLEKLCHTNLYMKCLVEYKLPYNSTLSVNQVVNCYNKYNDLKVQIYDKESTLENIKYIIDNLDQPCATILDVYEYNSISLYNSRKVINLPKCTDNVFLSHSILIVGYNDEEKYLVFQNSFGEEWGYNGFGLISYDYITKFRKIYTLKFS